MTERPYELVLFGATGFTGGLTAEYLARRAAARLAGRWPDATAPSSSRSASGLRQSSRPPPSCRCWEPTSRIRGRCKRSPSRTKVVITTVGPYIRYGEPLVAACAQAGTDYVDLTGEPEFVDRTWLAHHARASETGARLVHSCGFDSVPTRPRGAVHRQPTSRRRADHGQRVRAHARDLLRRHIPIGGRDHGPAAPGPRGRRANGAALEPRPQGRTVKGMTRRPYDDDDAGGWVVSPPLIDPLVVLRSAARARSLRAGVPLRATISSSSGCRRSRCSAAAC